MAKAKQSIIDFYDQESPYVTEFRRLLHKISNSEASGELKSLMLTSSMLSEGKSTVCSLLGITAAIHKGIKTLIVDADLRRPAIHGFFNLPAAPGLVEILVEGYNPREAVQKTSVDKLDIVTAGRYCSSPSEVFDAEAIGSLIEELKFYYDLILIDSPPLVPVSDPMLLASKVDGILLVVKAGDTQKEVAQRALEIVDRRKNNVIGVVLNNMAQALPFYYNYGYYHYEYVQSAPRSKGKSAERSDRSRRSKRRPAQGKETNPTRVE